MQTGERVGSTRYHAESHVANPSSGCGKTPPYTIGTTTKGGGTYAGVPREWLVYVPSWYDASTATPLVLAHHGWGGSDSQEEAADGLQAQAEEHGFIAVYPQGMADNANYGSWGSWNCVGSTESPGKGGATCAQSFPSYCYTSCKTCSDDPQCWWTTCDDDVTPSGSGKENVNGFIPSLYDTLESQLCIDTSREYATGMSNGGMMTFQLGASMGSRLAAVVPICGSFHKGFNEAPSDGVPILATHGFSDYTVPANGTPPTSSDGYFYTAMSEIYGGNEYSSGWKTSNNCSGEASHYVTPFDGASQLYCVSEGSCSGGDVVRCAFSGGHTYAPDNGALIWWFVSQFVKKSHIGKGCSVGKVCANKTTQLQRLEAHAVSSNPAPHDDFWQLEVKEPGHYGDPANGCLEDEDIIPLAGGRVCAPRIRSTRIEEQGLPTPQCKLGGMSPFQNGCPQDVTEGAARGAWPTCLAKGNTSTPYENAEFHCMLVCGPCELRPGSTTCGEIASAKCPGKSKCMFGELRQVNMGVCTYFEDDVNLVV